jgi:16S rRNA (adenine1518-N6/adenine1519-N6)-dimethyltransferase
VPGAALGPRELRALLERHGLTRRRALGQHFLADPNTARRIVRLAGVRPGDRVLEVGPGLGSLTAALVAAGARVRAIEVDEALLPALREVVGPAAPVEVVVGDVLRVDLDRLVASAEPCAAEVPGPAGWKMVSNLPYNIATAVVLRLLEGAPAVREMLVMTQREAAERLCARPGGRAYGAASVRVAYHARARIVGRVPPTVFLPPPRVESALVHLQRHPRPPVEVGSYADLVALLRAGFAQRRKMLRSSLRARLGERTRAVLAAAGVPETARAEALDLGRWAALARAAATTPPTAEVGPGDPR